MASQAVCEHDYNRLHNSHLDLHDHMRHPIAFLTEVMGDIMCLHQALRQPEAKEFMEAVMKEVMVTLTMTIGSSSNVPKYQKARRLYHQYGQFNTSKT